MQPKPAEPIRRPAEPTHPTNGRAESIRLPAELTSAAMARQFVRSTLRRCGHHGIEDEAELCVTELVANVIRHTECPECVVTILERQRGVTIEVRDEAPESPSVEPISPFAEGGRGMQIIEATAAAWGVRREEPAGKAIWLHLIDR